MCNSFEERQFHNSIIMMKVKLFILSFFDFASSDCSDAEPFQRFFYTLETCGVDLAKTSYSCPTNSTLIETVCTDSQCTQGCSNTTLSVNTCSAGTKSYCGIGTDQGSSSGAFDLLPMELFTVLFAALLM